MQIEPSLQGKHMMRAATPLKVAVLVALGLCTLGVTTTIVGQTGPGRTDGAAGQQAAPPTSRVVREEHALKSIAGPLKPSPPGALQDLLDDDLAGGLDAHDEAVSPNLVSSSSVVGIRASVAGRKATVALRASMFERSAKVSYVWSLRVYDRSEKPKIISEHYYKEQIFKIPLGTRVRPMFRESFELPPGTYRIEVGLHRLKDGFDIARLADEAMRKSTLAFAPISDITIASQR